MQNHIFLVSSFAGHSCLDAPAHYISYILAFFTSFSFFYDEVYNDDTPRHTDHPQTQYAAYTWCNKNSSTPITP